MSIGNHRVSSAARRVFPVGLLLLLLLLLMLMYRCTTLPLLLRLLRVVVVVFHCTVMPLPLWLRLCLRLRLLRTLLLPLDDTGNRPRRQPRTLRRAGNTPDPRVAGHARGRRWPRRRNRLARPFGIHLATAVAGA